MSKKNIISLIIIVVLVIIAIMYLNGSNNDSSSTLTINTSVSQSDDSKYIYSLLQKMAQVRLDDSIFSSAVFQSLKDNTVTFGTQEIGRDNPFAPVGNSVKTSPTTIKAPIIKK
jgi:hypothetical protein